MNFEFSNRAKIVTYVLMAIGILGLIGGFITDTSDHHNRFWSNIMINGFYFLAISLGALFFYALTFATETSWAVLLRRVFESVMSFVPWGFGIMVIVFLAGSLHLHHIFHWMDPAVTDPQSPAYDEIIANKSAYLNIPFFWVRTIVYIAVLAGFAYWFRKRSLKEDEIGGDKLHTLGYKRGALFLVFFAVFSSTMAWDWLMSIDTHWFSTLYGWYVFSGMWVAGMNFVLLLTMWLISKDYLPQINHSHIHDLGKWVFALSFLWSYLWFSQFMLIWYSNIPEEVTYFQTRIEHYPIIFFGMFIINFVFPMLLLMSRDAKRNPQYLIFVGTLIFIGHWIDIYTLITPGVLFEHWHFGWFEIATLLGFFGLFVNRVLTALTKASLVPRQSPYLEESLHHHV